jgi:hypothetical protein
LNTQGEQPGASDDFSGALLVQYILPDKAADSHYERWENRKLVEAAPGKCQTPDVVVTRPAELDAADFGGRPVPELVAAGSHTAVHLPAARVVAGVFPPPRRVRNEITVFDPIQHTTAHIRCCGSPFGDVTFRLLLNGREYSIGPLIGDEAAELNFSLEFGYFLTWLHLATYLGPALWRSGEFATGNDLFLLSLLDGVVCAGSAAKGYSVQELSSAIERLVEYATCRTIWRNGAGRDRETQR